MTKNTTIASILYLHVDLACQLDQLYHLFPVKKRPRHIREDNKYLVQKKMMYGKCFINAYLTVLPQLNQFPQKNS